MLRKRKTVLKQKTRSKTWSIGGNDHPNGMTGIKVTFGPSLEYLNSSTVKVILNSIVKMNRNIFGDKRPKFECYSITNIDPSSELLRIGAR